MLDPGLGKRSLGSVVGEKQQLETRQIRLKQLGKLYVTCHQIWVRKKYGLDRS